MNLHQRFLDNNDCYRAGRTIRPQGVMVHSTGANNPYLRRYVQPDDGRLGVNRNQNHWNQPGVEKCVHAFLGKLEDGSVATYQTLPWTMRGWHCAGSGNDTHISFEICEDDLRDEDYFRAVYREAAEITAALCAQFDLDPLSPGVVLCHKEGWRAGIASNHSDVEHWFPRFGVTMDDFRALVSDLIQNPVVPKKEMDDMTYYKRITDVPEVYRPTLEKLVAHGALEGDGQGNLSVSEDFCRVMTVLDRFGSLDGQKKVM